MARRVLSVPSIDACTRHQAVLTPSIHTVFQQVPDKRIKHFPTGSYIVKEGEQMTGFYLIKASFKSPSEMKLS